MVFSEFLGPRLANACSVSVRELYDAGHLSPAAMGEARRRRPGIRGDHSAWSTEIEPNGALAALARAFESLGETVGAQTRISVPCFDLQIACYPGSGARYRQHVDAARPESMRRITAICYLNPGWCDAHGGVLRCHTPTGDRLVEPSLDRLVVFRSDELIHEVLPSHALRFAVTAWFRGDRTP